jgi:hypothetical protein
MLLKRLTVVMMAVVIIAESPPPIRITPPGVIIPPRVIIGGIWTVIIFLPKVDLFAQKKGIPVFHLTEGLDFLSLNISGHCDSSPSPENIGV